MNQSNRGLRRDKHERRSRAERLESRYLLAAPHAPVIIEPFSQGQITGTFDINMQTDPAQYSDADGDAWQATQWRIREQSGGAVVWDTGFLSSPPLTLYRVDFSDGSFVGSLAGKTELNYSTNYQLVVHYRDANSEVSADAVRNFTTAGPTQPVPGAGTWLVRPGYVVEPVETGLRLPVNIAFVPNAGPNPNDPLYYVNELYGSIEVVRRNGTMSTFATGLLDYNPQGPISGAGEQGLTGLAVERDSVNPDIYHLYVSMLWDNGSPPGAPNHYPKVERIDSTSGGLTMATRTVLLNMQPETQGQSHQISNVTIGPDGKLYVHVGDGFNSGTAFNLDQYRGKILRMNKDGSAPSDNPFYNAANGINSRDYIYTYGHRNPFGGAWRAADGKQWIVENGNSIDRLVDLTAGASYGWAGDDSAITTFSKFNWNPSVAPVNIDFVESSKFGGSMFPAEALGNAYATLSGSTYAAGPQQTSKAIVEFSDLNTLNGSGKLLVPPSFLVKYNGTGRATVAAVAAGPDGLYFSDLYEDTGASGATAPGANIYRVRYVGDAGGQLPTVAVPAQATTNPVVLDDHTQLSALGADDGGEGSLTYTWGTIGSPPAPVSFNVNATNAAKNVTATFVANGAYDLYVMIRDAGGQAVISSVTVTVNSILTDTGAGVLGAYFNNIDFTSSVQTRVDPTINFDWGTGAPISGMGVDTFSVRWTGFIAPRFTQTYTFYTTTDDGVRLWVNDLTTPIIDKWIDQGATTWSGTVSLNAGTLYSIRMDYYENAGSASAKLEWASASQSREVVPAGRLYAIAPSLPTAPGNLVLNAPTFDRINLGWTDNANNESGFRISRSTNGTTFTPIATLPAGTTSFADTGLSGGMHYYYRVSATNLSGDSGFVQNDLTTPVNFPAIYNGTADADSYYVRRDGTELGIWINGLGVGAPDYIIGYAAAPALTFNGNGGGDTLTVDNSAGNAIPVGGITFDGGANSDTLAFIGTAAAPDTVTYNAGSLVVSGLNIVHSKVELRTFDGQRGGDSLSIYGGAVATTATQVLSALTLAAGATLDLRNNDLILNYTKGSPLDAVQSLIHSARNGGDWLGDGLTSTSARDNPQHNTTLGAIESADYAVLHGGTFDGETIVGLAVLVKYTYYGDANFDGQVNFDDYVRTDVGFNTSLSGWSNGDFNDDGVVNFDDYVLLDIAFNTQGSPLSRRPSSSKRG